MLGACAPKPSSVPLGVGPLAVAEREGAPASPTPAAAQVPRRGEAETPPDPRASDGNESDADERPAKDAADAEEQETAEALPAPRGGGPASFLGLYSGEDVAVFTLPGFPEREQRDDKAKIRVEAASGDNVGLVLVNSEDGSDLCEIVARIEGNAAVIESAQPCFTAEGDGGMQAELSSGRAVFDGDRLNMDAAGVLFVNLGDQDLEGELSYTFQGVRQSP